MKYRVGPKEKRLTLGPYPEVSLLKAREACDQARRLLRDGVDPGIERQQRRAELHLHAHNTLEIVTRRCHEQQKTLWTPRYATQVLDRFENDVFPALGALPIRQVTVPLILAVLQKVQARGATETAHRIRQHLSDVFGTAIAHGIATADPAGGIRKTLDKVVTGHRPAVRRAYGMMMQAAFRAWRLFDTGCRAEGVGRDR